MPHTPHPLRSSMPRRRGRSVVALLIGLLTLCASTLAITGSSVAQRAPSPDSNKPRAASGATKGLFRDAVPRSAVMDGDRRSVELGVKFRAKVAGRVTGAQVYKLAKHPGKTPVRASLWNADGDRLASVRLPRTRGTGWVSARFDKAVRVKPGHTYRVSVFAPKGRYAVTEGVLDRRKDRGDLMVVGRSNGVYAYSSTSSFPRETYNASNYWVDVTFRPGKKKGGGGGGTTTTEPTTTTTPTTEPTTTTTPTTTTPTTTTTTTTPAYPTAAQAGVPAGWSPSTTFNGTYTVSTPGAVVQDLRVNGSIVVAAPNVTLRRVDVVGGSIDNFRGPACQNGLVVEDSTIRRSSAQTTEGDFPALGAGGYTARRVEIDGLPEGFRVGGRQSGCGPVSIEGSFARVVRPDVCGDWHGDGLQGYGGAALTVRNTTLELVEDGCGGTAPFFYPKGQDNTSVDIDGLMVRGGGFAFRLGTPGTVRNLAVVNNSWTYGPINVACSALSAWDARIVNVDAAGTVSTARSQPCDMQEGN